MRLNLMIYSLRIKNRLSNAANNFTIIWSRWWGIIPYSNTVDPPSDRMFEPHSTKKKQIIFRPVRKTELWQINQVTLSNLTQQPLISIISIIPRLFFICMLKKESWRKILRKETLWSSGSGELDLMVKYRDRRDQRETENVSPKSINWLYSTLSH